ncbi:hypothetical protein QTP70_008820 [Hemibagrus guttatus]|uniref:Alkylated DNA repair protein AlkB homologue 8 N-terminal domain-containing protein n=1 Tax=Hemibagrus guttatus TaxID=175788 RepID=A0AAE0R0I3_9TELE|nr:hypothetical protein QTP70_008820 [Hemibagrus guttatus]KAK3562556.1 hypothetical protein QTP86_002035 [Hemibagrus guttatus]
MIVDMRKERRTHQPLFIREREVERVSSFKYLGVHISEDFTWTLKPVKKAQQRLYFLWRLRKFRIPPKILNNFYSCVIESVLTNCITVWYGSTTIRDRKHLQRVVNTAEKIIRAPLPSMQTIYHRRVPRSAASILKDPTHTQHRLFTLLPSGRSITDLGCKGSGVRSGPCLMKDRYVARTGVTGAPPWSQAWGWGTQASTWWPSLCLRDSAGHSPKKRRRPSTRRKEHKGPVQCVLGSSHGRGPQRPKPWAKNLAFGTWNVTSLGGKEPELVREGKRYRLEIVRLDSIPANASTPATGCSAGPKPGKNGRVAAGRASGVKPVPSCCADQSVRCGDPEQGAAESNFL